MPKSTRIFERLPSDAGITFEGFKDIKITSRESVKEKLENFVEYCKDAKKPAMRVVIGEWVEDIFYKHQFFLHPIAIEELRVEIMGMPHIDIPVEKIETVPPGIIRRRRMAHTPFAYGTGHVAGLF